MNELEKFVASIPSPVSREKRIELIKQWKIDNKWGEEKPQLAEVENITYGGKPAEEVLESVKTGGDAAGADVEPTKLQAPVNTDFGGGIGSSELAKQAINFNTEEFVYGDEVTASSEELLGKDFQQNQYKQQEIENEAVLEAEQLFNNALKSKESGRGNSGINVFESEESSKNFNQQVFNSFIAKNKIIQEQIIPQATIEADAAVLIYAKEAQEKYGLTDPESYTQEKYDEYLKDVESYYNTTINNKIAQNKDFKLLTSAFDKKTGELSQNYSKSIIRKENRPTIFGIELPEGGMAEAVYRNFVGIDESLKGLGRNLSANESVARNKHFERNLKNAKTYNWTDDTVGYFVNDPGRVNDSMRFDPKDGASIGLGKDYGIVPNYKNGKEITWGEFKKLKENNSNERKEVFEDKLKNALEEQIIAEAFNDDEFTKITEGIEVGKNVKNLVAGQLPNMFAAVITLGGFTALTVGSDIYTDSINNRVRELRSIEAKKQGITLSEQELYAPATAEEQLAVISDEKWNDAAVTKASLGGFIGGQLERVGAAKAFKPFATKTIAAILRGNTKKVIQNAAINGVNATKSGISESVTEVGQGFVQDVASGNKVDAKNYVEAGGTGLIVGTVLGGLGSVKTQSAAELKTVANVLAGRLNSKSSEAIFNAEIKKINDLAKIENDPKTREELLAKRNAILEVKNANNKIPSNISEKNKKEALDLLIEKESLSKSIEGKDPDLVDAAKLRLKDINERLRIIGNEASIDQEVEFINKVAPKGTLKVFDTIAEFVKVAGKENADVDAFIDVNGVMYINKQQAAKVGAITAASHERLHQILRNVFSNPDAAMKLVDDFKKILKPKELAVIQKRIDKNYADASPLKQAEEYLTAFSDAIGKGELNWSDNLTETFIKLGKKIVEIFKGKGYENIDFKNGRDVYNFIKDYQSNTKKGKQDTRTEILSAVSEGITTTETQESKTTDVDNLASKYKTDPSSLSTNETQNLKEQYTKLGIDALKQWSGKRNVPINNLLSNPNTFKSIESDVLNQFPSIMKNYTPINKTTGKPQKLSTYIGNILGRRVGPKLVEDYAKQQSTQSISNDQQKELESIQDTSKTTVAEIDTDVKLVDNIKIDKQPLSVEFKDKVRGFVTEQLEGLDPQSEQFRKQAFKPSKAFVDLIAKDIIGNPKKFREFLNENPTFYKGLNITELIAIDDGRVKKGQPRLFTEVNRRLTKQSEIEKFMMQGRVPYLTTAQQKAGANLYNRLTPKVAAVVNNFFGSTPQNNSNRKKAIAKAIANKFIAEAAPSTNAFKAKPQNVRAKTAEKLQVSQNAKFSRTISDNKATEALNFRGKNQELTMEKIQDLSPGKNWSELTRKEQVSEILEGIKVLNEGLGFNIATSVNLIERGDPNKAGSKKQLYVTNLAETLNNKNISAQRKAEIKKQVENGELIDLSAIKDRSKASLTNSDAARTQTTPPGKNRTKEQSIKFRVDTNLSNIKNITKAKEDVFLNLLKVINKNPSLLGAINSLLYKVNNNSGAFRNMGTLIGMIQQKGYDQNITVGEHVLQYNEMINLVEIAGITMDPALFKSMSTWLAESYVQVQSTNNTKDKKGSNGKKIGSRSGSGIAIQENNYPTESKNLFTNKNDLPAWNAKVSMLPDLLEQIAEARNGERAWKDVGSPLSKYFSPYGYYNANTFKIGDANGNLVPIANIWGAKVPKKYQSTDSNGNANFPNVVQKQAEILSQTLLKQITIAEGQKQMDAFILTLAPGKAAASKLDSSLIPTAIEYDRPVTVQVAISALSKTDKALNNARRLDAPVKKIRVFDFDDTLARSKSMVIVNMPDGSTTQINATQFAQQAADLESQGAKFDFSEFSKVVDGKKGPLFEVAKKIAEARGTEDVFILTARPQNADGPIKTFMKANGIDIPLKNITGLGDGTAQAKAGWMMGKAAEGYNDFYFADDAIKNVKAVEEVLSQIDVKSKVQIAKFSKTKTFDTIVNDMIEDSSGIETYKQYSAARAQTVGANKGRFNFFIPASAEDFTGLLYKMLGKGKKGDAQMAFLKTNLLDPYDRAESAVTQAKIAAANDFKALKQNLKTLPKSLSKPTGIGGFTFSHAVRVAIWSKQGMDIPGLSKKDIKELNDFVDNNAELSVFTDELMKIQKGKSYPKPGKSWLGGNITGDIINDINKVNRAEYQQEWRENVDIIFSEDNMNKMEAAYGTRWREAMEDSLRRMKSGSNRPPGGNRATDGILDWLNNSVGAVMFLNTRSALLQTISAVNFINWGDNNIVKAGVAFANQKQFWSDFMTLMNSDYLVERRNGLKINVSESEIADAVRDSDNKVKSAIAFLLSKGFVMTRFADSFAIASGGSTFYRNRVKALVGKGMEQKAAEAQAFEDFRQIAEESQQSSNPNRISQQQASGAGRVILAWANTPMQYARIQKRAAQDLINGRGDWKTNVSKIVYYGAVQNLIFNALQQAVFALGFGEDDEEEMDAKKSKKISRIANGMIDSQLKGLGIGGAAVVALKSTLMELGKQYSKNRPKYEEAVFDLLGFSPPLGSKVQKINGGLRSFSWNMKDIKSKGFSLDNPAYLAGAQITTGLTNIPLDRVIKKLNSMRGIVSEQSSLWQKVALGLGWSTWDVGLGYYGGFDAAKVLTPEEEKVKEIDDMKKLTKTQEQIDMLLDLGLTKKEIKALGKEQVRVEKIIELQNAEANPKKEVKVKEEIKEETKSTPEVKAKPKTESVEKRLRRQFDSIKDENKPDQVKTLLKFGLTKKEIRTLQYEKNRVNKILELMEKNK